MISNSSLGQRNREIQQTSTQICTGWRRGPPHHKTFTVYLELGAEKYEGTGTSIKKEIAI